MNALIQFGGDPRDESNELPHNTEAEQALLGALLVRNEGLADVRDTLAPSHFHDAVHGRIYESICSLVDAGKTASPLILRPFFEKDEALTDVGGASYLLRLATSAISTINVTDYSGAIIESAQRRELLAACQRIAAEARAPKIDKSADDLAADLAGAIDAVRGIAGERGGLDGWGAAMQSTAEAADAAYKNQSLPGVSTGLQTLDRKLGGFGNSDLIVIAGRSSMGKSALLQHCVTATAEGGKPAALFSLEMRDSQLGMRDLARHTGIAFDRIRRGDLGQQEIAKVMAVAEGERKSLPLYLDTTRGLTVAQIRSRCLQHRRRRGPLAMVAVDYLGLVRAEGNYRGNIVAETGEITRALKGLAGELDCPVLLGAQLNRGPDNREDHRPTLADLRWSGDIEQDADVVLFLFRAEYYLQRKEPMKDTPERDAWEQQMDRVRNIAEVIIGKQRNGPTETVPLYYNAATNQFRDLAA